MPLSEQEQRLLDEMERSLYQNDAEFAAKVNGSSRLRSGATGLVVGVLVAVAGIAVLVAGVVFQQWLIGVLGFAVMFAGVLVALGSPRRLAASNPLHPRRGQRPRSTSRSFMDRMNDRWDRRQNGS